MKTAQVILLSLLPLAASAVEIVRYPRPESTADRRLDFPVKMLELALQKAGGHYELQPSVLVMPQSRALLELKGKSAFIDVTWTMTSKEREAQALPIRIPIDRGLLGWRLPLVNEGDRDLFRKVRNLTELARLTAGQGHDWPDTAILRSNGQTVVDAPNYELLFRMLGSRQFMYFPRSVNEVWRELDLRPQAKLAVADHVVLHYVAPLYYFVSKNNKKLAAVITRGMEKAIADGSYEQLFQRYYGDDLKRTGFEKRRVIELSNSSLPESTPLGRAALWFKPARTR
jgi:hypothetical protein